MNAQSSRVTWWQRAVIIAAILTALLPLHAQDWETALRRMPLKSPATPLTRSNCADIILGSFVADPVVKAIVFMPGATDELYFFRRIKVQLTNASPTLLDAIQALSNQSVIKVTFQQPLLLLHTDEDTLNPEIKVEHAATFERLHGAPYATRVFYDDWNWDDIYPDLRKLKVSLFPDRNTYGSRHFFRPTMAAWNLTGIQAVRAISLASKTVVTVKRNRLVFTPDERREKPSRVDVMPPGTKPAIRELD